MGNEAIDGAILERVNETDAIKVLVTIDENGAPHPVVKGSIEYDNGRIALIEILESSQTNRNLTRAIWFDKPIALLLICADRKTYKISLKAARSVVSGKLFTSRYEKARAKYGDLDVAAAWFFEVTALRDESIETRLQQEREERPYFNHLDRLAKKENI
ncbi:MAG: hypothetical protein LBI57_07765 [Helicobacteraceae bacterium]|jgi:hypothetical protein|nr:hypothetical protein [Helicobacteraceae bacterium]